MITDEQRKNRIIGASDAAALLGVSRYKTRRQLYEELAGDVDRDDISNNIRVRVGTAVEELIIDMHDEMLDLTTQRDPPTVRLEAHPWVTVHLDGVTQSGEYLANVEAKKVGLNMAKWWGENGTDQIDPEYLPQVHMQMWAADCERTHVAALIGDDDFRIYFIGRDPDMDQLISQVGDWFWSQVQDRDPPPIDYDHITTLPLLKKMYPGTNGETIHLPDEIEHWDAVSQEASAKIKLYQSTVDCAKAHILELMQESAIGKMDNGYEFVRQQIEVPARTQEAYDYIKQTRRKTRAKRGN